MSALIAPFPWFGGKRRIAADVWARLGDCASYVEPFFGSGAVLLARPGGPGRAETVNDADGLLSNFWRAVSRAPDEVARHADWPVNECDLHARHLWLVGQRERLTERLMADAEFFDAQAAGWWVWGCSSWIGSGWCSGRGPWIAVNGKLVNSRQMPHVGNGQGISRQMPHVGTAGRGINRDAGRGITDMMAQLSTRLRHVRVVCGDWSRVMGHSVLWPISGGTCGVFLDPPYRSDHAIDYATSVCHDEIEAWCRDNGSHQGLRVALCGYDGEYDLPGWQVLPWKARGGYGSQGNGDGRANSRRERVWFSPHCAHRGALL